MIDIKKLSDLHESTPHGEWEAQTYSVAKQDGTENGVSIYVGDDSFGAFEFGSGWKIRNCCQAPRSLQKHTIKNS